MDKLEVLKLALQLMNQHGLYDWTFRFNTNKRRRGVCKFHPKRIELSIHIVSDTADNIRNTILHEIAHALLPPKHGHDNVWYEKALSIGCDGKRCGNDLGIDRPYTAKCPNCNVTFGVFRRKKLWCKRCHVAGKGLHLFSYTEN